MPFSVSGLATGLGGVEEGFQQQQADELRRQQLLFEQAATVAAGRGFQGLVPGASPLLPGAGGPGPAPPSQPGAGSGIPNVQPIPTAPVSGGGPSGIAPSAGNLLPGVQPGGVPPQPASAPPNMGGFAPGPVGPYAPVQQGPLSPAAPADPTGVMRAPVPGLPPRQQQPTMPQRLLSPVPYGGGPPQSMQPMAGQPSPGGGGSMGGLGGQPGGQPGGMPPGGRSFDWRQIVQSVVQSNPGASPQVIAGAVSKLIGWMNPIAQQEWREIQAQMNYDIRGRAVDARIQAIEAQNQRLQDTLASRESERQKDRDARQIRDDQKHLNDLETLRAKLAGAKDLSSQKAAQDLERQIQAFEARSGLQRERAEQQEHLEVVKQEGRKEIKQMTLDGQRELRTMSSNAQQEIEKLRQEGRLTLANVSRETKIELADKSANLKRELFSQAEAGKMSRAQLRASREAGGSRETATEFRARNLGKRYNAAIERIDSAIDDIDRGFERGYSVAGALGTIQRGTEFVLSATGIADSSKATAFATKIRQLLVMLPTLITGRSQSAKDERARIESIVGGVGMGQTGVLTVAKLRELRQLLQELKPETSFLGRQSQQPAEPGSLPGLPPGWTGRAIETPAETPPE